MPSLSCEIIFRVIDPETKDVIPWQECLPSLCETWVQAQNCQKIKGKINKYTLVVRFWFYTFVFLKIIPFTHSFIYWREPLPHHTGKVRRQLREWFSLFSMRVLRIKPILKLSSKHLYHRAL